MSAAPRPGSGPSGPALRPTAQAKCANLLARPLFAPSSPHQSENEAFQLQNRGGAVVAKVLPQSEGSPVVDQTARGQQNPGVSNRTHWKNTILAGLANYIDAGSIVAGAAGLVLWTSMFHLRSSFGGLIGAISSNAISAGVGALIGGRLCDKLGRKKIYQWDMLVYAFGLLFIIFAAAPWMLVVGYVIAGLAVGADVPASWTLIAELAPNGQRGKHSGVAQVLWYSGPVVVLLLSLAMSPLGFSASTSCSPTLFLLAICLWVRPAQHEGVRGLGQG